MDLALCVLCAVVYFFLLLICVEVVLVSCKISPFYV